MAEKVKNTPEIQAEQHEMFEYAQQRIIRKKRLFLHFVLYVIGGIFMFIFNKLLSYGYQYDWFVWGIMAWTFLFLVHVVNVYITEPFMGKAWQRKEREKLVALQQKKIMKMQAQVEKEFEEQKKLIEKDLEKNKTATLSDNTEVL